MTAGDVFLASPSPLLVSVIHSKDSASCMPPMKCRRHFRGGDGRQPVGRVTNPMKSTPSSAPQTPPLNLWFRGGKKRAALLLSITGKGFTCYAFFVAANFAFRTLRLRKVQTCAVAAPLHKNLFSENIFVRNMVILICAGALWGKSELTRAKLKALKNRVKRENEPRSCRGGVFSKNHGKDFCLCKKICVNLVWRFFYENRR